MVEAALETGTATLERSTAAMSHGALIRFRFRRNWLAMAGLILVILLYAVTIPAEFTAPYGVTQRFQTSVNLPPQPLRVIGEDGKLDWPFAYALSQHTNPRTFRREYTLDMTRKIYLQLFAPVEGHTDNGLLAPRKLIGFAGGTVHLLGTDSQGRDVLSRSIHGGRVSLLIGLFGVIISMTIGTLIGLISGYFGGWIDNVTQRGIEVLLSFPTIPLWMAFSAAVPDTWSPIQVFFVMSLIISFIGWASLARIVRGITLSLKNEEYVTAARVNGAGTWWVVRHHLLPGNYSYIIVALTLAIPNMILGETALSFLGLGIRPPMVSWGSLLQTSQDINVIANQPWVVFAAAVPVILAVLAFNFVGDGLRDAVDPVGR
jgi:peptide/nickel transport system permease protein